MRKRLFDKPGIYQMMCSGNNKVYIGSSNNLRKRWLKHLSQLRLGKHDNPYMQNSFNKYGIDSFTVKVIMLCECKHLLEFEGKCIKLFNTLSPHGFNLTDNPSRPRMSEETKRKISQSLKGRIFSDEHKRNLSIACTNKMKSAEHRQRLREANLGKTLSSETKEKISAAVSGPNNPFFGCKHDIETKKRMSRSHYKRSLTNPQVKEIRKLLSKNLSKKHISLMFGVKPSVISDIANRRTYKYV